MTTRKLGKYVMLETLGQGGFSKVRLGLDEATGEHVALKILKKKEMGITSDVIKQVEREIHAMSQIDHVNVIRLKEVNWDCTYEKRSGQKIQVILVVLELATGGELFDFLAFTGPFEEAIARTYFQQLISGIAHCHSKGIAHRDLKPENILLDSQFVLKLADFGFAASFNAVQNTMYTECGTPGYMAPEVFTTKAVGSNEKRGYDGASADIWSCGVVLFIQLAGFPPFQRPAMNDWWFNKLSNNKHHLFWEAHQRTAYFSDLVKDFLNKILCPDVTKRMKMEELQKHPWFLGPTISHNALHAELQRRKATVDENKLREKGEKAKEAGDSGAVPAQAGLLERGDVSMTRGEGPVNVIDYTSEQLPPAVPSITAFGKNAVFARVGDTQNQSEQASSAASTKGATMSSDAFSSSEAMAGGETYEGEEESWTNEAGATVNTAASSASSSSAAATTLPAVFSLHTQSFTRFAVSHSTFHSSARELYKFLQTTLTSLGCTLQTSDAEFKIKRAKCVTSQGIIEFSLQIFQDPKQQGEWICDFKKLSSDSTQFRVLYAEIRYKLKAIISTVPNETLTAKA